MVNPEDLFYLYKLGESAFTFIWNDLQKSLKLVDLVPQGQFRQMFEGLFTEELIVFCFYCFVFAFHVLNN